MLNKLNDFLTAELILAVIFEKINERNLKQFQNEVNCSTIEAKAQNLGLFSNTKKRRLRGVYLLLYSHKAGHIKECA